MTDDPKPLEVSCLACSWRTNWSAEVIESHLRAEGMLRRSDSTDPEVLRELLAGSAPKLICPECGTSGLRIAPVVDDGAWQDAVVCEICRKPIRSERLEAVPGTRRCARCQADEEAGRLDAEAEYCPRCGAPLVLRVARSGTTRYKLACTGTPPCRL